VERITHFSLPIGQTIINPKIVSVTPRLLEGTGPLVELIASTELDPIIQVEAEKRLMATTLAIRMDPRAAIELARQILALDLTKGWPRQQ
jgi:hypothetical protein